MKTITNKTVISGSCPAQCGFTIVELFIVLAIVAILATIAAPAMNDFIEKNRLKGGAELVYSQLNLARTESIKTSSNIFVNLKNTSGSSVWSLGINKGAACDSTISDSTDASACTIPVSDSDATKVLQTTINASANPKFKDISMTLPASATSVDISFEPVRGTSTATTITLTSPKGWVIKNVVSALGQIKVCSPSGTSFITGYPEC